MTSLTLETNLVHRWQGRGDDRDATSSSSRSFLRPACSWRVAKDGKDVACWDHALCEAFECRSDEATEYPGGVLIESVITPTMVNMKLEKVKHLKNVTEYVLKREVVRAL